MAVADSGNGISSLLPPDRWWFINTELPKVGFRTAI
jgi:hypothetical protein